MQTTPRPTPQAKAQTVFYPKNTIAIIISRTNWENPDQYYSVNFILADGGQTKQKVCSQMEVNQLEKAIMNTPMTYYFV